MLRAGICGANGYTGIELLRILDLHPGITVSRLFSNSTAGKNIKEIYPYLSDKYDLKLELFDSSQLSDLDVIFLALPHGQTHSMMSALLAYPNLKIIDLSADFRIKNNQKYEQYYNVSHQSVHLLPEIPLGFPEINRQQIKNAQAVANPGCYATSVILGLYPLAKEGLVSHRVIIDSKSGVTGAGRSLKESSLYCEANESISAYNTNTHRHIPEMEEALGIDVLFSPHLTPMNRGILSSMYLQNEKHFNKEDILAIFRQYYQNEPFIKIMDPLPNPSTKWVRHTNNCCISVVVTEDTIIVFSAIDNLIKGASGQAVQNMNLLCGFDETTALKALPTYI